MSDQYLQQLRSTDPAARRAAIIALADSPDPNAASILARISKTDPDPALRALAERGQRHAERKNWRAVVPEEGESPVASSGNYAAQVEKANAALNENQQVARSQLNNAYGSHNNGDIQGARGYLYRAFQLDPDLTRNSDSVQLAAELTGAPLDEAVDMLMQGSKGRNRNKKNVSYNVSNATSAFAAPGASDQRSPVPIGTLVTYILIECVVIFVILAGLGYVDLLSRSHNPSIAASSASTASAQLAKLAATNIVGGAAEIGGFQLFGFLIYLFMMYFVGLMMGGSGTIFDFFNVMLRVYIVMMIFAFVIGLLAAFSRGSISTIENLILFAYFVNFVVIAVFSARELHFDILRGILTVFAPVILLCLFFVLLALVGAGQGLVNFFSGIH